MDTKNKEIKFSSKILLTPEQLQNLLHIPIAEQSKMRMKKRQKNDKNPLPFVKIAGRILYRRESIKKWLENKEKENQ